MNPGDLTTLTNAKAWLGVTVATDDTLLARLINAQSKFIESWLNRKIAYQTYTERRNGPGGGGRGRYVMMFANPPVQEMLSLSINSTAIAASSDGGVLLPGYGFDENEFWLVGNDGFVKGRRNVAFSYKGGFIIEWAETIPITPFQLTPVVLWLQDFGVTVGGVAFAKVASSPGVGQYSVSSTGTYLFNTADAGSVATLRFAHIPADIEQACIDMVALHFKEKDRIGFVSKTIGTETISFVQKAMPDSVQTSLRQYKNVLPI